MNFEEIDFYVFYVNYLSKKEYENKKVLVGYNGVDGKEVTMSKFKEDINEIRDSRSTILKINKYLRDRVIEIKIFISLLKKILDFY